MPLRQGQLVVAPTWLDERCHSGGCSDASAGWVLRTLLRRWLIDVNGRRRDRDRAAQAGARQAAPIGRVMQKCSGETTFVQL
jgi:hypothetical protein